MHDSDNLLGGLLTEERTAAELKHNVRTLTRWRKSGKGPPHILLGRRIYYRIAAIEKWLEAQERTGPDRKRSGRAGV